MAGIELISSQQLYNLINQYFLRPYVSDPNYLLLLDARPWIEYEFQHIQTAKFAPRDEQGNFVIPYGADGTPELQYKNNVVVYDGSTSELPGNPAEFLINEDVDASNRAFHCASEIQILSKNPVKILQGGFQVFSALYHFLRTQKMIYMPRELEAFKTFPIEIIQGLLYLGNEVQGNDVEVQKCLKIRGHVVAQEEPSLIAPDYADYVCHCKIEDSCRADISGPCSKATEFIDRYVDNNCPILVWSKNETSRATIIVVAYLMRHNKWTLEAALSFVLSCHQHARPNRGFLQQLLTLENEILTENAGEDEDEVDETIEASS